MSQSASTQTEAPPIPKYPEHEKLAKISDKSQACGEFLDWLRQEKGYFLMEEREFTEERETGSPFLTPEKYSYTWTDEVMVSASTEKLLAEFFDIDQDKIDDEKRQMLDEIRQRNRIK